MYYRWFKCPQCGQIMVAPKQNSHNGGTDLGHLKTMYCFICKKKQDFVLYDIVPMQGKRHKTRRKS